MDAHHEVENDLFLNIHGKLLFAISRSIRKHVCAALLLVINKRAERASNDIYDVSMRS